MSNIPSTAIGAALTPVLRSANDLLRARKLQSAKDSHHTEEVEEIDDTAVNSVGDQQQRGRREKNPGKRNEDTAQEMVEIAALADVSQSAVPPGKSTTQLDISA